MGSGGPRGLQILLSGGSAVRGGFDSHTFPPSAIGGRAAIAGVVLGLLLAAAGPASAQVPPPAAVDSGLVESGVAAPADTSGGEATGAEPVVRGEARQKPRFFASPSGVMLRSLVIPGWGQATNGEWWKAVLVAGAEGYLIYRIVEDTKYLEELDPLSLEYAQVQEQITANAWWLGGVVFLSMVDAYVGAHLKGIEVEIGPEPGTQGLRVAVSREFR